MWNLKKVQKEVKEAIAILKLKNGDIKETARSILSQYDYASYSISELLKELKDEGSQIPKREIANALIRVPGARDDEKVILALIEAPRFGEYDPLITETLRAKKKMLPKLLQYLTDENKHVRSGAIKLIDRLRSFSEVKSSVPVLVDILNNEDELFATKISAARIIAEYINADDNAAQELIKAINKDPDLVTEPVAYSLGDLEPKAKGAEVPLAKALKSTSFSTRTAAIYALKQIGIFNSKETIFNLFSLLRDEDDYIQSGARSILSKAPEEFKILSFIELLKTNDKKKEVFYFFTKDIGPNAIPYLLNELNNETDPVNKANFLLLLGKLSNKCEDEALLSKVLNALIQGLSNENKWVRYNSCTSLELLGSKSKPALKYLEEVSKNENNKEVRDIALSAISEIK